jgi:alpha-aminoadipate carrier protein LysW
LNLFTYKLKNNFFGDFVMPTAVCPECEEDVYVDIDAEQGEFIACDECGVDLELVGLDPIELDVFKGNKNRDYDDFEEDYDSYDYDDDRY